MSWRPDFIESLKSHDWGWANATCCKCGAHARFSYREKEYCAEHLSAALVQTLEANAKAWSP